MEFHPKIWGGLSVLSPIDILKMEQTFQIGYKEGDKVYTCLLEIERGNMIQLMSSGNSFFIYLKKQLRQNDFLNMI
jgi:hypothetical protein